jgi:ribosomal protein L2
VRHRGGGHARRIRMVDFRRTEPGEHLVKRIEYDPNRSAHVALLANSETGARSYVVAAVGMRAGDMVQSYIPGIPRSLMDEMGGKIDQGLLASRICVRGNCLPIRLVPPGTQVHNVGSHPGRGAVFCRSAGTYATVVGKDQSTREFRFMVVKLSSGEVRRVSKDACATIGVVSNPMWQFRQLGKAGRSRWLNIRPSVRGLAMNACKLLSAGV